MNEWLILLQQVGTFLAALAAAIAAFMSYLKSSELKQDTKEIHQEVQQLMQADSLRQSRRSTDTGGEGQF